MVSKTLGEENGNSFQYYCLDNFLDRGAWRATVLRVTRVVHYLATKPLNHQVKPYHDSVRKSQKFIAYSVECHYFHVNKRAVGSQLVEQEPLAIGLIFKHMLIAGQLTITP